MILLLLTMTLLLVKMDTQIHLFSHPDFSGLISTACPYVRVNQESDLSDFWGTYVSHRHTSPLAETITEESDTNINQTNIDLSIFQARNCAEDIANTRNQD